MKKASRTRLAPAADALRGVDPGALARAVDILVNVQRGDGVIYTAGNGGSAATAASRARLAEGGGGARDFAFRQCGAITAWGNDTSFDRVFAEQLELLGREGDGVIVMSVSGSSPNVIALLDVAREKGMRSVGLLGCDGGRAAALVDVPVVVPSDDFGWVESVHTVLHHALTYALRDAATEAQAARSARAI